MHRSNELVLNFVETTSSRCVSNRLWKMTQTSDKVVVNVNVVRKDYCLKTTRRQKPGYFRLRFIATNFRRGSINVIVMILLFQCDVWRVRAVLIKFIFHHAPVTVAYCAAFPLRVLTSCFWNEVRIIWPLINLSMLFHSFIHFLFFWWSDTSRSMSLINPW